ncbi:MAG: PAS-domain containing protein [Pseudomonadota bacterium]
MFSIWTVSAITLIYLLLLFAIANWGNRQKHLSKNVYGLALGVHCTSWAYFGTSTQASNFGWPLVPTYLGCILVMLFGMGLYKKIATLCYQNNVSSLSEFVGLRFNHSNSIAGLIVVICFIGVIPYIALQLDAISTAVGLITEKDTDQDISISFYITVMMAGFAIWYGNRTLDLTQKHKGLMLTLAVESVVKLMGLLCVGLFTLYVVFDGGFDLLEQAFAKDETRATLHQPFAYWIYASHVLLGICAMFCLPRQFHVNFVENQNTEEIDRARWLFPSYLVAMSLFVLPIALAGDLILEESSLVSGQTSSGSDSGPNSGHNSDHYVLMLPVYYGNEVISIIAYIGGLAASTSMVIVATLALGNMVNTSLIMPLWLRKNRLKILNNLDETPNIGPQSLLRTRQIAIATLVMIAYIYHVKISQTAPLVDSGTIAIALLAQLFPAIVLGVYWNRIHQYGIFAGLIAGLSVIAIEMLYPAVIASYYFAPLPTDYAHATAIFLSLGVNFTLAISVSRVLPVEANPFNVHGTAKSHLSIKPEDLRKLLLPVLDEKSMKAFDDRLTSSDGRQFVGPLTILDAQRFLASHLGLASARILLNAISENQFEDKQEMSELVEQASQTFQFRHEILQSSISHLPQGISVVDSDLKLVAWNQAYETLMKYPKGILSTGKSVAELFSYNAKRELLMPVGSASNINRDETPNNYTSVINERITQMKRGEDYKTMRRFKDDKVIEITGSPLPGGGYITTYTDVSDYIRIQQQLEDSKNQLEKRVERRTQELAKAKTEAEQANRSKTKFLAAAGHDLMQPLNAATLFASMLKDKLADTESISTCNHLLSSLENADQQLGMLLDISKLESGRITPSFSTFAINDIFESLRNDYALQAKAKNIKLSIVKSSLRLYTDKALFMRIVQNLLSNAVRYTAEGKVLLGVRRRSDNQCEVFVVDTGSGIEKKHQKRVFDEFARLNRDKDDQGLGLGLTIVDRMCRLLSIDIRLNSELNKGSAFSLVLAHRGVTQQVTSSKEIKSNDQQTALTDMIVLVLENDTGVATALKNQFELWRSNVTLAAQLADIPSDMTFDLVLADFHLDNDENGVDVTQIVAERQTHPPISILSSADRNDDIRSKAADAGMGYLPKPLKSAALKRLIVSLRQRQRNQLIKQQF